MQAFFYRKSRYVSSVRKHRSQPRLQLPRLHRLQPRFSANTATAVNNNYSPQSANSTYLGASTTPAAAQRKHSPGEGSLAVNPSGGHHGVRPPIGPAAATAAVTVLLHADHGSGSSLKIGIHPSPLAWLHSGRAPRRPVLRSLCACSFHRSSLPRGQTSTTGCCPDGLSRKSPLGRDCQPRCRSASCVRALHPSCEPGLRHCGGFHALHICLFLRSSNFSGDRRPTLFVKTQIGKWLPL